MRALSQREVDAIKDFGLHGVAPNLALQVRPNGARSWIWRGRIDGVEVQRGLGAARDVSLADAKARAEEIRVDLRKGINPFEQRKQAKEAKRTAIAASANVPTFARCADQYIEDNRKRWKSDKHAAQWESTIRMYAKPVLGKLPVDQISVEHVVKVLKPIWTEKPETASRLRGRIEKVLGWATAMGYRAGDNPASWSGALQHILPPIGKVRKIQHRKAVPYTELPGLMAELRKNGSESARALRFLILTAARTSEVTKAEWTEFDMDDAVWQVPEEHMKAKRPHRVPLSAEALEIVRGQSSKKKHVFAGDRPNRPLSNMAMLELLRGLRGEGFTVHGMRSSFRDWAAECSNAPAEVVEAALAHTISSKTVAAYLRTDHLERRRALMAEWARFLEG
ncbi:MAG: tyrosine-type recombinase/integrase [Alphaproteobacteria bacterium]|nr:tyrosine-type recombinase/integrase [Alphaproteobacteria bacterium]